MDSKPYAAMTVVLNHNEFTLEQVEELTNLLKNKSKKLQEEADIKANELRMQNIKEERRQEAKKTLKTLQSATFKKWREGALAFIEKYKNIKKEISYDLLLPIRISGTLHIEEDLENMVIGKFYEDDFYIINNRYIKILPTNDLTKKQLALLQQGLNTVQYTWCQEMMGIVPGVMEEKKTMYKEAMKLGTLSDKLNINFDDLSDLLQDQDGYIAALESEVLE